MQQSCLPRPVRQARAVTAGAASAPGTAGTAGAAGTRQAHGRRGKHGKHGKRGTQGKHGKHGRLGRRGKHGKSGIGFGCRIFGWHIFCKGELRIPSAIVSSGRLVVDIHFFCWLAVPNQLAEPCVVFFFCLWQHPGSAVFAFPTLFPTVAPLPAAVSAASVDDCCEVAAPARNFPCRRVPPRLPTFSLLEPWK